MKTRIIFIAIIVSTLFACKKDKNVDPEISTNLARAESASTCYVKAAVSERGSYDILDYGFVYSVSNPSVSLVDGTKVSLGNALPSDFFSTTFSITDLYQGATYYVRAYITNTKGTVYGASLSFQLLTLSVTSVSPNYGKVGDNITIIGTNFSAIAADNIVNFNTTQAKVLTATSTKLVVAVPSGIQSNYYDSNISIYVGTGNQAINVSNFTLASTVSDFNPKTGTFGTSVTLTGDNLYGISIKCNDIVVDYYSYSNNSVTFSIPNSITTQKVAIKMVKNNIETLVDGTFSMDPMTITSITPTKGYGGNSISVYGTNFNTGYNGMTLKIGGVSASSVYSYSSTQISATVPTLSSGVYDVEVNNGIMTSTLPKAFTVSSPKVTSFSPSSGTYGSQITILGENLLQYSNVTMCPSDYNCSNANIVSQDSSKIIITVPYGMSTGAVKLHVNSGMDLTFADYFTINPLNTSITNFVPSSATPGTEVVITGTGFVPGSTDVQFGTVSAPITSITSTEIRVQVPSNSGSGAMKLCVVISGTITISSTDFTIL